MLTPLKFDYLPKHLGNGFKLLTINLLSRVQEQLVEG